MSGITIPIYVDDFETAVDFYGRFEIFEVELRLNFGGSKMADVKIKTTSGVKLLLVEARNQFESDFIGKQAPAGMWVANIVVPDFNALIESLKNSDIHMYAVSSSPCGHDGLVKDPFGNVYMFSDDYTS